MAISCNTYYEKHYYYKTLFMKIFLLVIRLRIVYVGDSLKVFVGKNVFGKSKIILNIHIL